MRNKLLLLLAAMWILSLATTHAVMAGQAPQPVNVATAATGQSGYIAALIENQGLDVKYGIKITNMMMDFTEAANAIKLGRAQASAMQPSTAVNLVKSGTDIRLITPQIWSGNSWVVKKESPYKTFADLKGKKIGNFARVTGAFFFSAVIAKEQKLDLEKDFQMVPADTGALIALLERGDVEAINMFEPHVTRLVMSGRYRVLVDFDIALEEIFGAPPLKSTVGMLKETVEKQPALVKAIRGAYIDAVKLIKSGRDEEFFKSKAKEFFNLSNPEEVTAGMKVNKENFADKWGDSFFQSQNKILQSGIGLGLLPNIGDLNNLWIK
ncbi:MAG TPA: PhnD/SsuA/transferrin family substrate-binding protein [Candidatus Limnocylindrales bacterium]|nr:PhnD/SsuA/transferrin family substrate-binding protein [Candidatus Limnocylindrales bacterium]